MGISAVDVRSETGIVLGLPDDRKRTFGRTDTIQFAITDTWVEKVWYHTKNNGTALLGHGYKLCINTSGSDDNGYGVLWTIGIDAEKYLHGAGINALYGDIGPSPGDTIDYWVENGYGFKGDTSGKIIGKISFVKLGE